MSAPAELPALVAAAERAYQLTADELRRAILVDRRLDLLATEVLGYSWEPYLQTFWDFCEGRIDVAADGKLTVRENWTPGDLREFALVLAPRGWGKSTALDVLATVLEILCWPDVRVLLASKTDGQAQAFLSEIKLCLEHPRLVELFGRQRPDAKQGEQGKWNEDEVYVRTRTKIQKEATVTALGAGGAVVSKHYDIIIGDDLVDENNSQTDGTRDKLKTFWYKTVLPTREPRSPVTPRSGRVRVLGTRYHHQDLYGHFQDKDEFFKGPRGADDAAANVLRMSALDRNGRSRYERKFSTEYLRTLRRSMGSIIFDSQYQNDISRMTGDIFQYPTFRFYECEDPVEFAKEHRLWTWQAVDLAIGQRERNDKFAIVVVGVAGDGRVYVLDFFTGKIGYGEQTVQIAHYYDLYSPIRCGIESNAYQLAKIDDIRSKAETADLRVVPIHTDEDKIARAWKLTAYFERGDIWFRAGRSEELIDQLLAFPHGKYKDLFDALDIAVSMGTTLRLKKERSRGSKRPTDGRAERLRVLG